VFVVFGRVPAKRQQGQALHYNLCIKKDAKDFRFNPSRGEVDCSDSPAAFRSNAQIFHIKKPLQERFL